MNRNIIIYFTILFLTLISCQERHPALFEEINGVYFYNVSGTMTVSDSTDVTFVYESGDETIVPVRIQLIGRPSEYDRKVEVTVSSENAREGIDYTLPDNVLIPAGETFTDYNVTLKRTAALKTERKEIRLEIHPSKDFSLPVTEIRQGETSTPVLTYRIYFSDMFTTAPKAWDENLVGTFTQQKFELICKVLQIDPDDFNDPSRITLAKLLYISAEMTAYVEGEIARKEGGETYDAEAFDHDTGEPLVFTKQG